MRTDWELKQKTNQKGYSLIHWVTSIERSTKSNNKQIHHSDTLTTQSLRANDVTEDSENRLGVVTEDQTKGLQLIHWVTSIERSTKSNNKQIH